MRHGWIFLAALVVVFAFEVAVMLVFSALPFHMPHWVEALTDATLLVALLGPLLYFLFFRSIAASNRALRANEERYRLLAENAHDVIYRISLPKGRYEYVSPASTALFGYSPQEFYHSPRLIRQTIHPDWRDYFDKVWANLVNGIAPPTYEYQIVHKSGETRWLNQRNVLLRDASGAPVALEGIVTDVTEQKRAQAALAEALRAKTDFMNNITHELRTPLNSVIGFADLLKDEVPGPLNAKQAGFVADILASGERLLKLVEGILDMSRLDAQGVEPERESVDIGAALQERLAAHRKAAEARAITMGMEVAADAGSAQLDPMALRRILDVLLDNALKFNREAGTVRVSALRADGMLEIAVADTGIGIAPADLPKLFQPLVQIDAGLNRRYGGIGLGLTLAKRLAQRHGGTIKVKSEPGTGSTFTLRLPMEGETT